MNIPFSPPDISDLEIQEVVSALKSGWITTGPKTKLFEKKIAETCDVSRAVCLSSATAALELTLRILGVGPGDEVITPAYTYTASAAVIDHVGAKIVFVDVAPGSFHMDPEKLLGAITERTKVVIPVDIGGVMCDYDKLFEAVERKKHLYRPSDNQYQRLFDRPIVLADAAHSFGAKYHGKMSGAVADFSCFSFHAVKNLTTAEGGALVWRDIPGLDHDELYNLLMLYSLHGQSKDALSKMRLGAWEYDILFPAYKCNMTDLTAAFGLAQIQRFPSLTAKRMMTIARYDEILLPLGITRLDHSIDELPGNGHLYMVRIPGISEEQRNRIIVMMAEQGVACNVHFKPLPMMTAYKKMGFDIKDYPNAYAQYRNEITLPLHTLLTMCEIDYVANTFKAVLVGNVSENVSETECQTIRVWENDSENIDNIYNIFKDCGDQMFLDEGLLHWADPLPREAIREMCRDQEVYVVKNRSNGSPYAFYAYSKHPMSYYDVDKKSVYLYRLAVTPSMWNRGIGSMCLKAVEEYARNNRFDSIRTTVYNKSTKAKAFFSGLGYVKQFERATNHFIVDCIEKTME